MKVCASWMGREHHSLSQYVAQQANSVAEAAVAGTTALTEFELAIDKMSESGRPEAGADADARAAAWPPSGIPFL
jgi:hypothetical protein